MVFRPEQVVGNRWNQLGGFKTSRPLQFSCIYYHGVLYIVCHRKKDVFPVLIFVYRTRKYIQPVH